jgi:hypothetical protein
MGIRQNIIPLPKWFVSGFAIDNPSDELVSGITRVLEQKATGVDGRRHSDAPFVGRLDANHGSAAQDLDTFFRDQWGSQVDDELDARVPRQRIIGVNENAPMTDVTGRTDYLLIRVGHLESNWEINRKARLQSALPRPDDFGHANDLRRVGEMHRVDADAGVPES